MNIQERLRAIITHSGLSVNAFAAKIGYNQSNLSKILAGKRDFNSNLENAICREFPEINRAWLSAEEGTMLQQSEAVVYNAREIVTIPLVGQYAYAGYLSGYSDPEYIDKLPTIDFMPDRHMTGNYVAFEVRGDSMDDGTSDGYLCGEILICREVEQDYWRDSKLFINKRDFVIVHTEGILIKRIVKHDVENHIITIHSLNPLYPDKEIDLAEVKQIFSVVESRRQRRR